MKQKLTMAEKRAAWLEGGVLAIAVQTTGDKKVSFDPKARPISVTHVTQGSCPVECAWMDASVAAQITGTFDPKRKGGCYGNHGHENLVAVRLNAAFTGQSPEEIARYEAMVIKNTLNGKNPLRLGIIGEAKTIAAIQIRAAAALEYSLIDDQPVWTYSHSVVLYRIPRYHYGIVSVFASCETDDDVAVATELGYACAVVRPFDTIAKGDRINGMKIFKCPQQLGTQPDCAACGFCMHADDVAGKAVLALDPHGPDASEMAEFIRLARIAADNRN